MHSYFDLRIMNIHAQLKEQVHKKLIEEGIDRILKCLTLLNNEQINYRPNQNSNSIANQVFHLNGNVRQWFLSAICGHEDARKRNEEFDLNLKVSSNKLEACLSKLKIDIVDELNSIDGLDLSAYQKVQCYEETNLAVLIHVMEHFSYHVGQITYITKMLADVDTGYYAGDNLTQVNE